MVSTGTEIPLRVLLKDPVFDGGAVGGAGPSTTAAAVPTGPLTETAAAAAIGAADAEDAAAKGTAFKCSSAAALVTESDSGA